MIFTRLFTYNISHFMCSRTSIFSFLCGLCLLLCLGLFPGGLAGMESESLPKDAYAPENDVIISRGGFSCPSWNRGSRLVSSRGAHIVQDDVLAVVVRVIDGDSLVVDIPSFPPVIGSKITVRIAGCDTPELRDKRPEIKALAQSARAFTAGMAPPGSVVWLRDIRRDKYFRLLARVETECGDIAGGLLELGFAVPYGGGKKRAWKREKF